VNKSEKVAESINGRWGDLKNCYLSLSSWVAIRQYHRIVAYKTDTYFSQFWIRVLTEFKFRVVSILKFGSSESHLPSL
jgi:hypothetical protein